MHHTFSSDDASVGYADGAQPSDFVAVNPDRVSPQGGSITRGSVIDPGYFVIPRATKNLFLRPAKDISWASLRRF
jgi:hypothetical protein